MIKLWEEYVDIRDVTHKVTHVVVPDEDDSKARIMQELVDVLTRSNKRTA